MEKQLQLSQDDFRQMFECAPGLYLILLPNLTIVAVSNAYLAATMTKRDEITGRNLFDVFPDNPEDLTATGVSNLRASLDSVIKKGVANTMAVQKYDIRRPDGTFEIRYWSPLNTPILDNKKKIRYIIHRVEDVTEFIQLKQKEAARVKESEALRTKMQQTEIEVYKRAQEIQEINKKLLHEILDRKKAEEKLRRSEERYQLMVNEVEDYSILLLDDEGNIMNWSKGAEKIKGYKANKIIGKNFKIFYTEQDKRAKLPERLLEEARKTGKAVYEGWRVRQDKTNFWGSVLITALHDDKKNIIGFTKVTRDFTERKRLEDQLKKFNEELSLQVNQKTTELTSIFERISDAFIAFDKNFNYTYVNKRTGQMINRDPESLIGKNVWDEFPDVVGSATYHAFTTAMAGQHYVRSVDYYAPLDLWQENHVYPSADGLSVFIKDITEQQKAIQKVENEKDFSNSIINSLPGIFYLFDDTGKMLRWNKNFETISGYTFDEINNMSPIDFFDVDEKAYIRSRIDEVFTKGVSNADAGFFTKDKKKIPFYFRGRMIELDNKRCLIGTGIDVTEKIKAQAEVVNSYKQIRALASHLQDIREEERTSISREIHDELGQQLTGLKMDISWIGRKIKNQDEEIDQKIKSTLELADETVKSIRRIATELRPSILDDLGLIAAIEWYSSEFEKRFGLKTNFFTELADISLMPDINTGLFRIYQESLTNVLRHARADKISSSLYMSNNALILNITDNGAGFDIDKITNKKTLGLLGMKERTLIMGGNYKIESNPGNGTSVTVSVPLKN